ncbi:hypothetical protein ACFL23_01165 [Patescibacteria group bacterium]
MPISKKAVLLGDFIVNMIKERSAVAKAMATEERGGSSKLRFQYFIFVFFYNNIFWRKNE